MNVETLKVLVGFAKFFLGSVVVALITFWVNAGFKDREIALSELEFLAQFKSEALNEDIEVRRRLAEYFSHLTLGEEMRQRWAEYLELIESQTRRIGILEEQLTTVSPASSVEASGLQAELSELRMRSSRLAVELDRARDLAGLVHCLVPGQVRRLGNSTYQIPRQPIRATTVECEIRGGEYVPDDPGNTSAALDIWLPSAEAGNAESQLQVGELYERGIDGRPDFVTAAKWFRAAAEQGHHAAQFLLGTLYQEGVGVEKSESEALEWFSRSGYPGVGGNTEAGSASLDNRGERN